MPTPPFQHPQCGANMRGDTRAPDSLFTKFLRNWKIIYTALVGWLVVWLLTSARYGIVEGKISSKKEQTQKLSKCSKIWFPGVRPRIFHRKWDEGGKKDTKTSFRRGFLFEKKEFMTVIEPKLISKVRLCKPFADNCSPGVTKQRQQSRRSRLSQGQEIGQEGVTKLQKGGEF